MPEMKIFKMNDCDHVAAISEDQAKKWYSNLTGEDLADVEEYFEGEVSLQNEMFIFVTDLTPEEQKKQYVVKEIHGQAAIEQTFEEVLSNYESEEPFVICSTEY